MPSFVDPQTQEPLVEREGALDSPNTGDFRRRVLLDRTQFSNYDMQGKSLLECGMGGGDDTEALLRFPFGESSISTVPARRSPRSIAPRCG